jgi:hypothetical protein
MEEIFEKDDALKRLIREEGLLSPSPDFTARVMQMVETVETKPGMVYKPLLNRTAWILIAAFMTLLLTAGWLATDDNPGETVYASMFKPTFDFLNNLQISVGLPTSGLLIATIAIACIGLLLSLDIIISHKYPRVTA